MNANSKKIFIIIIYILSVILGSLFWTIYPSDLVHFFGASSLVYSFVLATSLGRCLTSYLLLSWIVLFPLLLIVSFFIAKKKKSYALFIISAGVELVVTALQLALKYFIAGTFLFFFMTFAFFVKCCCYYGITRLLREE